MNKKLYRFVVSELLAAGFRLAEIGLDAPGYQGIVVSHPSFDVLPADVKGELPHDLIDQLDINECDLAISARKAVLVTQKTSPKKP